MRNFFLALLLAAFATLPLAVPGAGQSADNFAALDARVTKFLEQNRYGWRDMNVPDADGRALYDIVLKNGYKRALEIGTSTGHSGTWTAWALAKTGGRLITIDIDEGRHREALQNFKEAGLDAYIDARLADAHDVVPRLEGPFDFVFIDADKEWYTNYAKAVIPKVRVGGCIAAHNVSGPRSGWGRGRGFGPGGAEGADYYSYVTGLPFLETTVMNGQLAVSYKRGEK